MSALRIVGGIFAAAFFAVALIRYRRRQISRLNLIISSLISAALLLLAIAPGLFNPLFEVFNFEPGNGQRLTAVLLFSVGILFVLVIRMQSAVDTSERGIRQLVESFGQAAFDWDVVADLPAAPRRRPGEPARWRRACRSVEAEGSRSVSATTSPSSSGPTSSSRWTRTASISPRSSPRSSGRSSTAAPTT